MQWSREAETAVKKVPLFVRKRVRARVEKEVAGEGKDRITLADVKATQARFLRKKNHKIKGYQVDQCFGPSGCPNRAVISDDLVKWVKAVLKDADILGFLRETVSGGLKFHHEFRVSLADCPNACSQPQIKDIGIIGATIPKITDAACSQCAACVPACKEDAIELAVEGDGPVINRQHCLNCGQCMAVCPTGTLVSGQTGYRVQLGGKLGRHPQLARELPGIFSESQVLNIVKASLTLYKQRSTGGARFAEILSEVDFDRLALSSVKRASPLTGQPANGPTD